MAIKAQRSNNINEGRCFMKVLLIIKWKPWAAIIKKPINKEEKNTSEGNQIPVINKVAKAIFETPTTFRVKSFNPKDLNSVMTLWYLNVHTYKTDNATAIWATIDKFSIFFELIITINTCLDYLSLQCALLLIQFAKTFVRHTSQINKLWHMVTLLGLMLLRFILLYGIIKDFKSFCFASITFGFYET